jgi:P4 family phage/plasmid primase-like protien
MGIEELKDKDLDLNELEQEQEQQISQNLTKTQFEKELTKKYHFKSMKDTKEIYYYDTTKGIYVKDGEWLIEQECIIFNPESKTNDVTDIKNHITWSNYTDRTDFDPDIKWFCCKNVMINILTGEVKEHDPNFMATIRIPHVFLHRTPHIPLPYKILNFLHEVTASPDDVETILDFLAYCLWRGFPFHKWLLLNGSGRNGKGVMTELVTRFLGDENVSSESLHRLLDRNFASAMLYHKMANIDTDLSSEQLKQTGIFKKLTGNDWIPAEYKFKTPFHFKNYAKLIFSANMMPKTSDETDAYFARLLIINFPNQYLGDKANPYLIEELTTPEEMSYLMSLVLKRLPRVLKTGIFNEASIDDIYEKYTLSSDPVKLFSELYLKTVVGENNYETKKAVYDTYVKYCGEKGIPKESMNKLTRELTKLGYKSKDNKKVDKKNVQVWLNVQLIDYDEQVEVSRKTPNLDPNNGYWNQDES